MELEGLDLRQNLEEDLRKVRELRETNEAGEL